MIAIHDSKVVQAWDVLREPPKWSHSNMTINIHTNLIMPSILRYSPYNGEKLPPAEKLQWDHPGLAGNKMPSICQNPSKSHQPTVEVAFFGQVLLRIPAFSCFFGEGMTCFKLKRLNPWCEQWSSSSSCLNFLDPAPLVDHIQSYPYSIWTTNSSKHIISKTKNGLGCSPMMQIQWLPQSCCFQALPFLQTPPCNFFGLGCSPVEWKPTFKQLTLLASLVQLILFWCFRKGLYQNHPKSKNMVYGNPNIRTASSDLWDISGL